MNIDYLANYPHLLREVAGLHFAQWPALMRDDSVESREARLAKCCSRGAIPCAVIGLRHAEVCGFALLVSEDLDARRDLSPWLAGLYVRPKYRRTGVGSALVTRIEIEAKALTVPALHLYTARSESLYTRLGWQVVESRRHNDRHYVVMMRQFATCPAE